MFKSSCSHRIDSSLVHLDYAHFDILLAVEEWQRALIILCIFMQTDESKLAAFKISSICLHVPQVK